MIDKTDFKLFEWQVNGRESVFDHDEENHRRPTCGVQNRRQC